MRLCGYNEFNLAGAIPIMTLSEDEVALLKAILIALRGIKVGDIDKALVILAKHSKPDRYEKQHDSFPPVQS